MGAGEVRVGRFWRVAGAVVGVAMLYGPAVMRGQEAKETVLHLHGTVVDGVTHRPIGRALVRSQDGRLVTMTDGEGRFRVDLSVPVRAGAQAGQLSGRGNGVVAGFAPGFVPELMLMGQRPGYLDQGRAVRVALDASLDSTEVRVSLMPAAAVRGRVLANGVESTRNVRVELLRHQVQEGEFRWTTVGQQQTGSDGEFRFGELQPGEYTAMTAEWSGDEPFLIEPDRATTQYPPDFVGDAKTLSAAGKLHLRFGGVEQVELHLRPATYYPVRVPVQLPAEGVRGGVNVMVMDEQRPNGYALGWNARDRAVEGALPSGNYTLVLHAFGPQQSSARVPLVVGDGPVVHAPVAMTEGGRIPVRVHVEFTAEEEVRRGYGYAGAPGGEPTKMAPVQINLQPVVSGMNGYSSTRRNEQSEAVLEGVQAGVYSVTANSMRGYIARMSSGGVDLLQQPLTVGDGGSADPIDVTLRNDSGKVEGTVDYGGAAAVQYCAVYLLPLNGSKQVVQGYAQADGKLHVENVPPGSYRVLAMEAQDAQLLPYRDAEAMQAYEGSGTTVTVRAGATETVQVKLTTLVELEGGRR